MSVTGDESGVPGGAAPAPAPEGSRKRSHAVLWSVSGVAVLACVLIAVLASSKSNATGSGSSPLVGKPAPAISGNFIGAPGKTSLTQLRGQWVLVNFAASWCIPCREETPQLLAFAEHHAASGDAAILEVAFDETDLDNLAAFLRSSKATWHAVNDSQAAAEYGVAGIPQSFLVDPAGRIVATYFGGVTDKQVDSFIDRAS